MTNPADIDISIRLAAFGGPNGQERALGLKRLRAVLQARIKSRLDILITDTGPLITMARAGTLSALALPQIRVIIPDVVMFEATRLRTGPCAHEIIAFTYRNTDLIIQQATTAAQEHQLLLGAGAAPRKMAERAVAEIAERYGEIFPERSMLLVYDDQELMTRILNLPANIFPIAISDLVQDLQEAAFRMRGQEA